MKKKAVKFQGSQSYTGFLVMAVFLSNFLFVSTTLFAKSLPEGEKKAQVCTLKCTDEQRKLISVTSTPAHTDLIFFTAHS